MHEVITVSVGQAGNQIGQRFWSQLLYEHSQSVTTGTYDDCLSTFFQHYDPSSDGGYVPPAPRGGAAASLFRSPPRLLGLRARAMMVDMEEGVLNSVLRSPVGGLFDPRGVVRDVSGCGNNWAVGYGELGPRHRAELVEAARNALEQCESPQAFLLVASAGGGTGSGVGSYLTELLRDEFPSLFRVSASVWPAEEADDVVTAPYNFALSLAVQADAADVVLPISNDGLLDILKEVDRARTATEKAGRAAAAAFTASCVTSTPPSPTDAVRMLYGSRGRGGSDTVEHAASSGEPAHDALLASLAEADDVLSAVAHSRAAGGGSATGRPVGGPHGERGGLISRRGAVLPQPRTTTTPSKAAGLSPTHPRLAVPPPASPPPAPVRSGSTWDSMNAAAAHVLTNLTASMRFSGSLNVDLNELVSTLCPFPRLHFLQASLSPLHAPLGWAPTPRAVDALFSEAFRPGHQLLRGDPRQYTHLAVGLLARGDVALTDVVRSATRLRSELRMPSWNEDGFKIGLCGTPPPHVAASVLTLGNSCAVARVLTTAHAKFNQLYRVRAHAHHYSEVIDEGVLGEASEAMVDLVSRYNEIDVEE